MFLSRCFHGRSLSGTLVSILLSTLALVLFYLSSTWGIFFNSIFLILAGLFNAGPDVILGKVFWKKVTKIWEFNLIFRLNISNCSWQFFLDSDWIICHIWKPEMSFFFIQVVFFTVDTCPCYKNWSITFQTFIYMCLLGCFHAY